MNVECYFLIYAFEKNNCFLLFNDKFNGFYFYHCFYLIPPDH